MCSKRFMHFPIVTACPVIVAIRLRISKNCRLPKQFTKLH
jgi:hypothetical protein